MNEESYISTEGRRGLPTCSTDDRPNYLNTSVFQIEYQRFIEKIPMETTGSLRYLPISIEQIVDLCAVRQTGL